MRSIIKRFIAMTIQLLKNNNLIWNNNEPLFVTFQLIRLETKSRRILPLTCGTKPDMT